jgi:hypothetical protein
VITDNVHHDRALWGIRFPIRAPPPDEATVDVVEDDLEGNRDAMLDAGLQGLDLATIVLAFEAEIDREFIEHDLIFLEFLLKKSGQIIGSGERSFR